MFPIDVTEQELRNIQHASAALGMVVPIVTAVIIAASVLVPYIIYKKKEDSDRKLAQKIRWVELLHRFANDLYNNAAVVKLFLEIQQAVISRPPSMGKLHTLGIFPKSNPDRSPELARLLETINLVGLMTRLKLISAGDVAKSSIGYVTLIVWEHDEVREYVKDLSQQHSNLHHPEDAFPEIGPLVRRLKGLKKPEPAA